jgi:hypothetical protein
MKLPNHPLSSLGHLKAWLKGHAIKIIAGTLSSVRYFL